MVSYTAADGYPLIDRQRVRRTESFDRSTDALAMAPLPS